MRFWIDTEHDETHDDVQLMSLGAVAQDGREFYAISDDFDPGKAKPWIIEHVVPHLEPPESPMWMPRSEMANEFIAFVGEEPAEFWSLIATYDWYLVTRLLFDGLDRLPSNWPIECWDLYQWEWRLGFPAHPSFEGREHHALDDARWARRICESLASIEGGKPEPLIP